METDSETDDDAIVRVFREDYNKGDDDCAGAGTDVEIENDDDAIVRVFREDYNKGDDDCAGAGTDVEIENGHINGDRDTY
nr:hypothetical protein [Tanacetum cinerariifolium]